MKIQSKAITIGLVSALSFLTVNAHARGGAAATSFPVNSYKQLTGQSLHPEWANGTLGAVPLDGPYAPPLIDKDYPKTASQAQMSDAGISSTPQCVQYGGPEKEVQTLTVIPTSDTIDINYTSQTNVTSGTVWGAAFLVCSVTQGGPTATCSQTNENPALVTRLPVSNTNRAGMVGMFAYHGYVTGLTPGVPTTIRIAGFARGLGGATITGLFGQNCYGNLTVRY